MRVDSDTYSEMILELYKNPSNYGTLQDYSLKVSGGNPLCGDEVSFEVKIENQKIIDIKFNGHGCAISKASTSLLTEMVKGKKIEEILKLEGKDMFENLGQIIQTRIKCALLGLVVLKRGLEEYDQKKQEKLLVNGIRI